MLYELRDVGERTPSHCQIEDFDRGGVPSAILRQGCRPSAESSMNAALAGAIENDGWPGRSRCTSSSSAAWSGSPEPGSGICAEVRTGRKLQTVVPIEWEPGAHSSIESLVPDVVLRHGETVFVDRREIQRTLPGTRRHALDGVAGGTGDREHRHDIHQILAYAALFDAPNVVAVLAYPMHAGTWTRLSERGGAITHARIHAAGRSLTLALASFPMQLAGPTALSELTHQLSRWADRRRVKA